MQLSREQLAILAAVQEWYFSGAGKTLTLGGYAGTGKTTIIRELLRAIPDPVSVCAFTGKAAHVLQSKGVEKATTVHSLIYSPADACARCGQWVSMCQAANRAAAQVGGRRCPADGTTTRFARSDSIGAALIIVDEASMISERLQRDIEGFDARVLYVGDHGQLEPVGAGGDLMRQPALRLETIHRQAEDSQVLRFAHQVRQGGHPSNLGRMAYGPLRIEQGIPEDLGSYDVVLCGFNRTRVAVNRRIRRLRGYGSGPQPGDRVVCLRNDRELGLFNGMLATIQECSEGADEIAVVADDGRELGPFECLEAQFGAEKTYRDVPRGTTLWDYGYCLTTHKSQGSEWPSVCVLEQIMPLWDPARWRYTAATRASERLTYCMSEDRR